MSGAAQFQEHLLPTSVKVGYRVYRIEVLHPVSAKARQLYGECSHMERVIRVDLAHGRREAANTLLHELLHAAFRGGNLEDKDDEERTVSTLADMLSAIWIDSPEVMAWISENVQRVDD